MENEIISTEIFIRHYWDISVYQQALDKLKSDPKSFVIKVDLDQYSRFTIPIEIVRDQVEYYLISGIEKSRKIINKFYEQSPEIYNQITNINGKEGINNWTGSSKPETRGSL